MQDGRGTSKGCRGAVASAQVGPRLRPELVCHDEATKSDPDDERWTLRGAVASGLRSVGHWLRPERVR